MIPRLKNRPSTDQAYRTANGLRHRFTRPEDFGNGTLAGVRKISDVDLALRPVVNAITGGRETFEPQAVVDRLWKMARVLEAEDGRGAFNLHNDKLSHAELVKASKKDALVIPYVEYLKTWN